MPFDVGGWSPHEADVGYLHNEFAYISLDEFDEQLAAFHVWARSSKRIIETPHQAFLAFRGFLRHYKPATTKRPAEPRTRTRTLPPKPVTPPKAKKPVAKPKQPEPRSKDIDDWWPTEVDLSICREMVPRYFKGIDSALNMLDGVRHYCHTTRTPISSEVFQYFVGMADSPPKANVSAKIEAAKNAEGRLRHIFDAELAALATSVGYRLGNDPVGSHEVRDDDGRVLITGRSLKVAAFLKRKANGRAPTDPEPELDAVDPNLTPSGRRELERMARACDLRLVFIRPDYIEVHVGDQGITFAGTPLQVRSELQRKLARLKYEASSSPPAPAIQERNDEFLERDRARLREMTLNSYTAVRTTEWNPSPDDLARIAAERPDLSGSQIKACLFSFRCSAAMMQYQSFDEVSHAFVKRALALVSPKRLH